MKRERWGQRTRLKYLEPTSKRPKSTPSPRAKKKSSHIHHEPPKLTPLPDPHSPQPPRANRPTHNGRLRPRRPHPLLPPLRHLPPLLRQSPLRLHLRPGPHRLFISPHHLQPHVPSPGLFFSLPHLPAPAPPASSSIRARQLPHISPQRLRARILSPPARLHELDRHRGAHG